jgi:hypothetical protein
VARESHATHHISLIGTEYLQGSRETHIVALGFAAIRSYGLPHDGLFYWYEGDTKLHKIPKKQASSRTNPFAMLDEDDGSNRQGARLHRRNLKTSVTSKPEGKNPTVTTPTTQTTPENVPTPQLASRLARAESAVVVLQERASRAESRLAKLEDFIRNELFPLPRIADVPPPANSLEAIIPIVTKSPDVCHFFKLPLELRELIYRMLLTTEYYPHFASTWPKFHLHPGILLVNRQASAEAMRILYQGNDFIILKVTGVNLLLKSPYIPQFKRLSEKKVTSPVLRIKIAVAGRGPREGNDQQTVITTLEGLKSIICTMLDLENFSGSHLNAGRVYHRDVSLTLDCNIKAKARCKVLSDLILKPWDEINGLKELVLTGDITEPMRQRLEKYNLEGPFPSEVAARLRNYHSLAAQKFEEGEYNAARWC